MEKDSKNRNHYVQQSTRKRRRLVELENSTKRQKLGLDAPNLTVPKPTEYMVTAPVPAVYHSVPPPVNYISLIATVIRPDGSLFNPQATTPHPPLPDPDYQDNIASSDKESEEEKPKKRKKKAGK
jgi:hypothetical protein